MKKVINKHSMLASNEKDDSLMNSEKATQSERKPDDTAGLNMSGHILIRDKNTGEELVNKRNAIHYGNMANMVANALNNAQGAYLQYLAFGNGATSVDTSGRVIYKTPRVSEAYESSASLYSRTYNKIISGGTATDKIEILPGVSYTDIKVTCTLGYDEPNNQDVFDQSTTNEGEYIFDEIGLFSYPSDPSAADPIDTSTMLTHVIFHPVQKSQNRIIEIIYTVRIQLS
jgi:hypothetical protein